MTTNIYDQYAKAFAQVSASVIVKDGKQVGTIAFKFPKDGAGRLTCFLHIHGLEMVKGTAGGYGYDKKGAAFESACERLILQAFSIDTKDAAHIAMKGRDIGGKYYDNALRDMGYEVWGAV